MESGQRIPIPEYLSTFPFYFFKSKLLVLIAANMSLNGHWPGESSEARLRLSIIQGMAKYNTQKFATGLAVHHSYRSKHMAFLSTFFEVILVQNSDVRRVQSCAFQPLGILHGVVARGAQADR